MRELARLLAAAQTGKQRPKQEEGHASSTHEKRDSDSGTLPLAAKRKKSRRERLECGVYVEHTTRKSRQEHIMVHHF